MRLMPSFFALYMQAYQQRKATRGVHTGLDLLVIQICESGDKPYPCILSVAAVSKLITHTRAGHTA